MEITHQHLYDLCHPPTHSADGWQGCHHDSWTGSVELDIVAYLTVELHEQPIKQTSRLEWNHLSRDWSTTSLKRTELDRSYLKQLECRLCFTWWPVCFWLVLVVAPMVVVAPLPMLKKVTPALQGHWKDVEILCWLMKLSLFYQKMMDLGKMMANN